MEKIKELAKDMLKNFAYDITKKLLLVACTTGISFPAAFMVLEQLAIPLWCAILASSGIVALLLFFVLLIYQKISYKYVAPEKIDSDYTIVNKVLTFKYDDEVSFYEAEITLEFNKSSRTFYGKYYWSGSGDGEIRPVNSNHTLQVLKRRTRYIEYAVVFDKAYRKGKKITFKLRGRMNDPQRSFFPYFSTSIDVPTKRLKIVLQIDPEKYPIRDLEKEAFQPHKYDHEGSEQVCLNEEGVYTWVIENPQLSYAYSLTWKFKP